MSEKLIGKLLEPLGFYKVNDEYLRSINLKLGELDADLKAVSEVADSGSRVVDALNANDLPQAVDETLKFCEVDDEVARLKEVQAKVRAGETIQGAVGAVEAPELVREIARSVKARVQETQARLREMSAHATELVVEVGEKATNLPQVAGNWTLAEKLGTPEAVQSTLKKSRGVQKTAEDAAIKTEGLLGALGKI